MKFLNKTPFFLLSLCLVLGQASTLLLTRGMNRVQRVDRMTMHAFANSKARPSTSNSTRRNRFAGGYRHPVITPSVSRSTNTSDAMVSSVNDYKPHGFIGSLMSTLNDTLVGATAVTGNTATAALDVASNLLNKRASFNEQQNTQTAIDELKKMKQDTALSIAQNALNTQYENSVQPSVPAPAPAKSSVNFRKML